MLEASSLSNNVSGSTVAMHATAVTDTWQQVACGLTLPTDHLVTKIRARRMVWNLSIAVQDMASLRE